MRRTEGLGPTDPVTLILPLGSTLDEVENQIKLYQLTLLRLCRRKNEFTPIAQIPDVAITIPAASG